MAVLQNVRVPLIWTPTSEASQSDPPEGQSVWGSSNPAQSAMGLDEERQARADGQSRRRRLPTQVPRP